MYMLSNHKGPEGTLTPSGRSPRHIPAFPVPNVQAQMGGAAAGDLRFFRRNDPTGNYTLGPIWVEMHSHFVNDCCLEDL